MFLWPWAQAGKELFQMLVKVKFLLSLAVIFLPVGLCAAESFSVSGGGLSSPYFTFTDSDSQTPDFTTQPLYRGETYEFNASGVSTSHRCSRFSFCIYQIRRFSVGYGENGGGQLGINCFEDANPREFSVSKHPAIR